MSNLYYRIASSPSGLETGYLFPRKIPPPTTIEYKDYSVRSPQGDGGETRHGYASVELSWDRLDKFQAEALSSLIDQTADLYLTIPALDGSRRGYGWIDVYGKPSLGDIIPLAPLPPHDFMYGNVVLKVNNLTILNDPADI